MEETRSTSKVDNLLNQLENLAVEKIQRLETNNNKLEERLAKLEALLTSEPNPAAEETQPETKPEEITPVAQIQVKIEPAAAPEEVVEAAAILEKAVVEKEAAPAGKLKPKQELAKWVASYPEIFNPKQPKPLQVGIHTALQAATGLSEKEVKRVLANYVKLPRYFACVQEGATRIDLAGQESGKVTAEEAAFAQQNLAKLKAKRQAKAKRAAKFNAAANPVTEVTSPQTTKPAAPSKPRPKKPAKAPVKNTAKPAPKEKAFTNTSLQDQLQSLLKK